MMRDEGSFNPSYMAITEIDAANFPDLADKHFVRAAEKYVCDSECQRKTSEYEKLLEKNQKYPPRDKITKPDTSNKLENQRTAASMINFMSGITHSRTGDNGNGNNFGGNFNGNGNLNRNGNNADTVWPGPRVWESTDFTGFGGGTGTRTGTGRFKRQAMTASAGGNKYTSRYQKKSQKNELGNIGSVLKLYCWKDGDLDENAVGLHRLCRACKSIRYMPDDYFPPLLNEVTCDGTGCLRNEGQCVQKYVSLDILKNNGTMECQQWSKVSVQISVCCDCQLRSDSVLTALIKRP